jgi:hypothetical protein
LTNTYHEWPVIFGITDPIYALDKFEISKSRAGTMIARYADNPDKYSSSAVMALGFASVTGARAGGTAAQQCKLRQPARRF